MRKANGDDFISFTLLYYIVSHISLLIEAGYEPDIIYTSRLKRAIRSVWTIVQELDSVYLPIFKSWRLNERMYGDVTGLSKKETAKKLGSDVVQAWYVAFSKFCILTRISLSIKYFLEKK